MILQSTRNKDR